MPPILPELRTISDAWLESKNAREKGFSLGKFEDEYLRQLPCAIVRPHNTPSRPGRQQIGQGWLLC